MSQLVIQEMDVHALPIVSTMVELPKPDHFGLSLVRNMSVLCLSFGENVTMRGAP